MDKIGFIGGGNMAEALIKGLLAAKLYPPQNISVSDIRCERLEYLQPEYNINTSDSNADLVQNADTIVLCTKPQQINEVLTSIKGCIGKNALVISIAAGIKVKTITSALGNIAVIRVMPNTPALISEGASAMFANRTAKPMLKKAEQIFSAVGKAIVIEEEGLIDAVTAVSGSGPAYYFLLTEKIIEAAVELGLSRTIATELVLQTAKGAALLACQDDGQGPEQLRKKVTSPGGTTEAAINILEDNGFGHLMTKALTAARDRSRELSG